MNNKKNSTIAPNDGEWTEEEIELFFKGYNELGRRWKKISLHFVKTRTKCK